MSRYMTQVSNDGAKWENVGGMPAEQLMSARGPMRQSMIEGLLAHFKCDKIRVICPAPKEIVMWKYPA